MRDYEELVKSLRICADSADPISECCFSDCCEHDEPIDPLCMGQLIHMAADAIEELLLENDALGRSLCECDDLLKKLERPKWISVKERPPEPRFAREWYLVALESGCVKTLAYEKSTVKGALFHKGWHETASPVTHWMPLPEPPKMDGGTDDAAD